MVVLQRCFVLLVAALTFFGFGFKWSPSSRLDDDPVFHLGVATVSGVAALLGGMDHEELMQQSQGGRHIAHRPRCRQNRHRLPVRPRHRPAAGKVTVKLQNRTVEYLAVTRHEELATGTPFKSSPWSVPIRWKSFPLLKPKGVTMSNFSLLAQAARPRSPSWLGTITVLAAGVVFLQLRCCCWSSATSVVPATACWSSSARSAAATPAQCIHGGAALRLPLIQDYAYLSLEPIQIEMPLKGRCRSRTSASTCPASSPWPSAPSRQ